MGVQVRGLVVEERGGEEGGDGEVSVTRGWMEDGVKG